jgi:hypothetical protein
LRARAFSPYAQGLFPLVALFIWFAARYDPLTACLLLGLLFVAGARLASLLLGLS